MKRELDITFNESEEHLDILLNMNNESFEKLRKKRYEDLKEESHLDDVEYNPSRHNLTEKSYDRFEAMFLCKKCNPNFLEKFTYLPGFNEWRRNDYGCK